ncbi:MAG: hypothetical protein AAGH90_05900, partial [Pseudomonadota bacterium]
RRLSATMSAWSANRLTGQFRPYLDVEIAQNILHTLPQADMPERAIIGSANSVSDRLREKANEAGANELFILTITESLESRIASYALLDEAWRTVA